MSNILPNLNLDDYEIRDSLNGAGGISDNVFGSKFRKTTQIDKWSRKKPTKYYKLIFANGSEDPKQWQADNGLCGFTDGSVLFGSDSALVSAVMGNQTYIYDPPRGGDYPMRIGDYRGYYPKAMSPILSFDFFGQIAANDSGSSMTFRVMGNDDVDEEVNLTLKDFLYDGTSSAEQMLLYIIITDTFGGIKLKKAGGSIGSDKGFVKEVSVSQDELGESGTYYAIAALCDAQERHFMALPIGHIEFQVINSVDADKLGWVFGSGSITYDGSGQYTYTGQLSYSPTFEDARVWIELQINNVDTNNGEEVELKMQSQSDGGKMHYMTYSRTMRIDHTEGNTYRLRCGYGSGWLNNAYLDLGNVQIIEPTSNAEG